jgi:hypothetical protein
MSTKRLFQVFDEMNVNDEKNKTAMLPCAFTMVEAKTDKRGGLVTMGVEAGIIQKLFLGECQAALVVFDKKEYHRLADEPVVDKLHEAQQEKDKVVDLLRRLRSITTWLDMPDTSAELLNTIDNFLK